MRTADVLRQAQPPARRFGWALAAGFGTAISAIALLAASAWLITRSAEQPHIMYITAVVVAVRAFAIGRGVFRYLERLTGHDQALGQLAIVRADLVRRIIPLAPDGLGGARRGAMLSRLVDDVDELQNLPLRVVMPLGIAGLASVASVVFIAFLNPAAAVAVALCLIAAFALAVWVGWRTGATAERQLSPLRAQLTDALVDEFTSLDVLAAFGATDAAHARVRRADDRLRQATVKRATAQGFTSGAVSLLAGLASLAALLVALPTLGDGGFDGPALAVVVLLPMAVFEVFGPVPLALASWRQVRSAAERIAETVPDEVPVELPQTTVAATDIAPPLGDGVTLRGVAASWPERASASSAAADASDAGRLEAIDLRIAPGERLLVSGPSGAGKTTLAHVLVRFLEYSGSFRIGGVEARDLNPDDVRKTIGLSEQTPFLFDETLRQNLVFAHDTATDAELWRVLERVGLADWATERGGLDGALGERGALVSGGQAQRIALARAILADFPVLVLDEPTAGVDSAASDALLRDLLTAAGERAVVLISHVAPPEGLIDREVRMEAGRLV